MSSRRSRAHSDGDSYRSFSLGDFSGDDDWSDSEESKDHRRKKTLGYTPTAPPPKLERVRSRIDNKWGKDEDSDWSVEEERADDRTRADKPMPYDWREKSTVAARNPKRNRDVKGDEKAPSGRQRRTAPVRGGRGQNSRSSSPRRRRSLVTGSRPRPPPPPVERARSASVQSNEEDFRAAPESWRDEFDGDSIALAASSRSVSSTESSLSKEGARRTAASQISAGGHVRAQQVEKTSDKSSSSSDESSSEAESESEDENEDDPCCTCCCCCWVMSCQQRQQKTKAPSQKKVSPSVVNSDVKSLRTDSSAIDKKFKAEKHEMDDEVKRPIE